MIMRDLTLDEIAAVVEGSTIKNGELRGCCPAHGGDNETALSMTYEKGKLLATCHTKRCTFEEIISSIRERLGNPQGEQRAQVTRGGKPLSDKGKPRSRGKRVWDLRDEGGELVAQHVREDLGEDDKKLWWKLPDGTTGLNGKSSADLPLYRAQEAARAPAGTTIVVVEGEKAADALAAVCAEHQAPITVVATVTGASGTPSAESLEVLRGRRVTLWPDNDGHGFEHMGRIAERLVGVAEEIRWFEWTDASKKGADAADHPGTASAAEFLRGGLLHKLLDAERWSRPPAIEGRVRLGEAIKHGIEPPEELLPDILLAGKSHNIYAPGGIGKTWALIWTAAELVKREKKVAIFDLENGPRTYAERFEEVGVDPDALDEFVYYWPFPTLNAEAYTRLLAEEQPDCVMFDSWIGFLASEGFQENESIDISTWAERYIKPALRQGCTFLVLDHVPHDHKRERGSSRKRDEMDVVWELKQDEEFNRDSTGSLSMHLRKDREGWLPSLIGWEIGGDPDTGTFNMFRDDSNAHEPVFYVTADEREVLDLLPPEGLRSKEWERLAKSEARISRATFYRRLTSLKDKKAVEIKDERYVATGPQDQQVSEVSNRSHETNETDPNQPGLTGLNPVSRDHETIGGRRLGLTGPTPRRGVDPAGETSETVAPSSPPGGGDTRDRETAESGGGGVVGGEEVETDEPQDLGAKLRRIRDDIRRKRDRDD